MVGICEARAYRPKISEGGSEFYCAQAAGRAAIMPTGRRFYAPPKP
nr:hypothetical protein GCM10017611_01480 [Rhodococcus wratislaviensis]